VIDNEELLKAVCGSEKVAAFKEVKRTSMKLAGVVREVVAEELDGSVPPNGKQFLTTSRGTWRLAARANSDNSTERAAHRSMGVGLVQVFGDLPEQRRAEGWIDVADLYALHAVRLDQRRLLRKVARRLN
jgi:hypothetical protein